MLILNRVKILAIRQPSSFIRLLLLHLRLFLPIAVVLPILKLILHHATSPIPIQLRHPSSASLRHRTCEIAAGCVGVLEEQVARSIASSTQDAKFVFVLVHVCLMRVLGRD